MMLLPASMSVAVTVTVWLDAVVRVTVGVRLATFKVLSVNKVGTTWSSASALDGT